MRLVERLVMALGIFACKRLTRLNKSSGPLLLVQKSSFLIRLCQFFVSRLDETTCHSLHQVLLRPANGVPVSHKVWALTSPRLCSETIPLAYGYPGTTPTA